MINCRVSSRIRAVQEKFGLTKRQVAELFSVSERTVNDYLADKTEPKYSQLQTLIDKFGISCNWLMTGEGEIIEPEASTIQMSATDLTYYTRLLQIKQARIEELEAELARVKSIAV